MTVSVTKLLWKTEMFQLLDMNGDMFTTADATYADGKLTTEGISFAEPPADGSIRVTTAGGSATYEVMYDNF